MNLPKGVPKVDGVELVDIRNSKLRHEIHNLDRFEPQYA
jgi:hypothetical protein